MLSSCESQFEEEIFVQTLQGLSGREPVFFLDEMIKKFRIKSRACNISALSGVSEGDLRLYRRQARMREDIAAVQNGAPDAKACFDRIKRNMQEYGMSYLLFGTTAEDLANAVKIQPFLQTVWSFAEVRKWIIEHRAFLERRAHYEQMLAAGRVGKLSPYLGPVDVNAYLGRIEELCRAVSDHLVTWEELGTTEAKLRRTMEAHTRTKARLELMFAELRAKERYQNKK